MRNDFFVLTMKVRDYECDMASVVNNAVYLNYLENARHEFLKSIGIDFAEYSKRRVGLLAIRAELDFKWPLVSGDVFTVSVNMERISKLRFLFNQEIVREKDRKLVLVAKIFGTVIDGNGRPKIPEELNKILNEIDSKPVSVRNCIPT